MMQFLKPYKVKIYLAHIAKMRMYGTRSSCQAFRNDLLSFIRIWKRSIV